MSLDNDKLDVTTGQLFNKEIGFKYLCICQNFWTSFLLTLKWSVTDEFFSKFATFFPSFLCWMFLTVVSRRMFYKRSESVLFAHLINRFEANMSTVICDDTEHRLTHVLCLFVEDPTRLLVMS